MFRKLFIILVPILLFSCTSNVDETEVKKDFSFSFVNEKASLPNQINDQLAIGHPDQMNKYMNQITCYDVIQVLLER